MTARTLILQRPSCTCWESSSCQKLYLILLAGVSLGITTRKLRFGGDLCRLWKENHICWKFLNSYITILSPRCMVQFSRRQKHHMRWWSHMSDTLDSTRGWLRCYTLNISKCKPKRTITNYFSQNIYLLIYTSYDW